jgi:hypothetical protein
MKASPLPLKESKLWYQSAKNRFDENRLEIMVPAHSGTAKTAAAADSPKVPRVTLLF